MITRKGISLLIITTVTALLAVFMRDIHLYAIASLGYAMFVVSFFISCARVRRLSALRCMPKAAFAGDTVPVSLDLKNESFFQEGPLKVTDSGHSAFIADLEKKAVFYSYDTIFEKRGIYEVGPILVEAADSLGIFKIRRHLNVYSELVVYPVLFGITHFPLTRGVPALAGQSTRISGDYEEFYGIREYKIDDGLRKIHWPSTARLGELMVKQYQQSAIHKTTIILDLDSAQQARWEMEDSFECSARIAGSIAKYIIDKNMRVQLIAESSKPYIAPLNTGEAHLFEVLDLLARINPDGDTSLEVVFDAYERVIPKASTVVLIFSNPRRGISERLIRLASRRISTIAILIGDAYNESDFNILQDWCSYVYVIKEADAAKLEDKFSL